MEKVQVIDNISEFKKEVEPFLHKFEAQMRKDYLVLGIIGAQSSGKSTLLNSLFQTNFAVMDSKAQRKQTTKGIWVSVAPEKQIVVLDIEGSDSRERWEEKSVTEKKTALFGLVLCNILVVNVWLQEIGRFSASNYEILKIILELNLRDFAKDSPKKILFVIRDFEERENLEYITRLLVEDVQRLWTEIKKPHGMENMPLNQLVDLQVAKIGHLKFNPRGFEADVATLRERLTNPADPKYIFKLYEPNSVPFDTLYVYMRNVWDAIVSNKDLNIPNQKTIVASYRCDQIKKDTLSQSLRALNDVKTKLKDGRAVNLKAELMSIRANSVSQFRNATSHYDASISSKVASELSTSLDEEYSKVFKLLDEKKTEMFLADFEAGLRGVLRAPGELPALLDTASQRKKTAMSNHKEFLSTFELPKEQTDQLSSVFKLKAGGTYASFLAANADAMLGRWRKQIEREIEEKIYDCFKQLTPESWAAFNTALTAKLSALKEQVQQITNNEDAKAVFTPELMANFQKELSNSIFKLLKTKKFGLTNSLLENFKSAFEINETGARRNWRNMADNEIEKTFSDTKALFQRNVKLLDSPLVVAWDNETVATTDELGSMKNELMKAIDSQLDAAFNVKYNRNSLQKVPGWLWAILVYFMHDNVLDWLSSPLFVFVLLILIGGVLYLVFTGKWQMAVSMVRLGLKPIVDIVVKTVRGIISGEPPQQGKEKKMQ